MPSITSSPRITELERQWYQVRVPGAKPQDPLTSLQMVYWHSIATNPVPNAVKQYRESELQWLRNVIAANGGTPTKKATSAQLWKEMAAAAGLVGGFSKRDFQRLFYLNVTTSP